jgi:hypothetical protein
VSNTLSTTFRVGCRYRCTITLPVASLKTGAAAIIDARWEPHTPARLTKAEMRDYRRGRDILLTEAARYLGGNVAVVEI